MLSHVRRLARRQEHDLVADADAAGFDPAGDDAAVIEFVDVLHGDSQRQVLGRARGFERIDRLDDGRTLVPAQMRAAIDDHVALARRNRNEGIRRHAERGEVGAELRLDAAELGLAVGDLVHLVDDDR